MYEPIRNRGLAALVSVAMASGSAPLLWGQSSGRAIFVSNNGNLEGSVTAFRVTQSDALELANRVVTGSRPTLNDPCAGCNAYEISLSPSGRWLATGHPAGTLDGITIFEVAADATITQRAQITLDATIGGPLDVAWLDDEYLAVTRLDTTPDRIAVYRWNPVAPSITFVRTVDNGGSLAFLCTNPTYDVLYSNDSVNDQVLAFAITAGGNLTLIGAYATGGPFPLEVASSPDGDHVYTACGISGTGRHVVGYEVQNDGSLTLLSGSPFDSTGASTSNVFVSADGSHVIVGHGTDATMRTMSRNATTGALLATGALFDVGLQGTLGDVRSLDDLVFVTDNSTATDGLMGIYVFRLGSNGSLTQLGPIVSTGGIAPRSIASWKPPGLPGDMNCDGIVSISDIGPFVLALTDPAAYAAQFPDCDINNADLNGDQLVSVGDIGLFVALLTGP